MVLSSIPRKPSTQTGLGALTEFVSDCVILLDHRIREEISTRRLRIIKYRGSTHGTNEYPFLIDDQGISVLPISSLGLDHDASTERVSSGIARLDGMLGGKGFYRGSSILASGTAGTDKSTIAACFVDAACRRGERALFFAFEESPQQIVRNTRSIGIDLEPWVRKGLLQFHAARPTYGGIEQVLLLTHKHITSFQPSVVVVDAVTNLLMVSTQNEVRSMLTPRSTPIVSFGWEKFLLCFAAAVLTFFIAGPLCLLRFERVDHLGAHSIPSETGLLIPSDFGQPTPSSACFLTRS